MLICRSSAIYFCTCLFTSLLSKFLEIFYQGLYYLTVERYFSLQCSPQFFVTSRYLKFIGFSASARLCLYSIVVQLVDFLKISLSQVYMFNFLIDSFFCFSAFEFDINLFQYLHLWQTFSVFISKCFKPILRILLEFGNYNKLYS